MDIGSLVGLLTSGPDGIARFVAMVMFKWFAAFFQFTMTWWMQASSTDVFMGNPNASPDSVVNLGLRSTSWLVYALATASMIYAITRVIIDRSARLAGDTGLMLFRIVVSTGAAISLTYMFLKGADIAGPWLAGQISGLGVEQLLQSPMSIDNNAVTASMKGSAAFIVVIAMVIALPWVALIGFINFLFVIGTYVIVIIVNITLPLLAATSANPEGKDRFQKAVGWLVAAVSYKVVAGIVAGVSMGLFSGNMFGGDKGVIDTNGFGGAPMGYLLTGMVSMFMFMFILPVLIKLAVPGVRAVSGIGAGKIFGTLAVTAGIAAGAVATGGLSAAGAGAGSAGAGSAGGASALSQTGAGAAGGGTNTMTSGGGLDGISGNTGAGGQSKSGTSGADGSQGSNATGEGSSGQPGTNGSNTSEAAQATGAEQSSSSATTSSGSNSGGGSGLGAQASQMGYATQNMLNQHERDAEEALGEGQKL